MKTFCYPETVAIFDTNMQQTAYWTRIIEWFGKAREIFFLELIHNPPAEVIAQMLTALDMIMDTRDFQITYLESLRFGDKAEVRINTSNFGGASVVLVGKIFKILPDGSEKLVAECRQKLGFCKTNGNFMKIPDAIRIPAMEYLLPEEKKD